MILRKKYKAQSKIIIFAFFQVMVLAISRQLVGPLIPVIAEELDVGLDFIGSAISLSIFALLLVSLSAGNLIEIIGLKKVLSIGLAASIAGSIILFFSYSFPAFIIAYFMLQLGIGIIFVGNLSIVGKFSSKKRTSSLLKVNMGSTIAFMVAPLLVSLMLFMNINWRYYYLLGTVFLTILIIILWKIKIPCSIRVDNTIKTLFAANKKIISNASFIICGIIAFFYVSVINTFFMWFTSYYQNIDIDTNISSLFLAIYGMAVFIGMILRHKLINYFKEKSILLFGFISSFFLLVGILFIKNLILKNILVFLFGIAIAGNFSITFSIGSRLFPGYPSSASGLMVAFANLGIMVFQYLSGYFSEYYSKNSILYINICILFILIILTSFLNFHKRFKGR